MAFAATLQLLPNDHPVEVDGGNRLFDEFERLKTFPLVWNGPFSKNVLARNGFYISAGKCICVFCTVELQPTERDLWELHREMMPECPFVNGGDSGNVELGDATNYRLEKHRLVSFLRTNWTAPVDPYDLAKWGFYWTGTADVGRCTFCRLEVRGWEQGDRGQSEHERWNPQCAFIQRRDVGNIPLGEENSEDENQNLGIQPIGNGPRPTPSELGIVTVDPPRHVEYVSMQSRLNSYQTWPLSLKQRPQELAEAGFYYTGKGDLVICFQCGGGLKDWGPSDEPWVEHAVWFTQCSYVIMKKGQDYIKMVQEAKNLNLPTTSVSVNISNVVANSLDTNNQRPDNNRVQQYFCKICYQKELPCGRDAACKAFYPSKYIFGDLMEHHCPNHDIITLNKLREYGVVTDLQDLDTRNGRATDEMRRLVTSSELPNATSEATAVERVCKLCGVNERCIIFLPCRDVATCTDCAVLSINNGGTCPICQKDIKKYLQVYLP